MEDAPVAQELQQRPAGGLGEEHHVQGQPRPPALSVSRRVAGGGEPVLGRQLAAALGVVADPVLHAGVQDQTQEPVQFLGLLKGEPGQVFVPERRERAQELTCGRTQTLLFFESLLSLGRVASGTAVRK